LSWKQSVQVKDQQGKLSARALATLEKLINDRYGHMKGSQALCRVADVLCSCCRDIDTPARFGGDEFALVLPETCAEAANLVALRVCESVANDGNGPKLSVSVGVAVYPQTVIRLRASCAKQIRHSTR